MESFFFSAFHAYKYFCNLLLFLSTLALAIGVVFVTPGYLVSACSNVNDIQTMGWGAIIIIYSIGSLIMGGIFLKIIEFPGVITFLSAYFIPLEYWAEKLPDKKSQKALLRLCATRKNFPEKLYLFFNKSKENDIRSSIIDIFTASPDFYNYLRSSLEAESSYADSAWKEAQKRVKSRAEMFIKLYGIPASSEKNKALLRTLSLIDPNAEKRLFQLSFPAFMPLLEAIEKGTLSTKRFIHKTALEVTQEFTALYSAEKEDKMTGSGPSEPVYLTKRYWFVPPTS